MPQIDAYLTAPYQGVSQAPPQVRLAEQAELVQDCGLNISEGVSKRPPITWLGTLTGHPGQTDGVFQLVARPDGDRILTATLESGIMVPRVYSLDTLAPESVTVSTDAQTYLDTAAVSPITDLDILTVQDFTFLTNRSMVVANGTATAPTRPFEALLWVKAGGYGWRYWVDITPVGGDTVHVRYTAPDGEHTYDSYWVDTAHIASILVDRAWGDPLKSIADYGGVPDSGSCTDITLNALESLGFTVTYNGPVIYLSHPTVDFTVEVQGPDGGNALVGIKEKVNAFSGLPLKAVDGFVVRITNETAVETDDFFVSFNATAGVDGTWEECMAPGGPLGLDPKTMPVGLVDDGGWQVNVLDWSGRTVGDATLDPDPDFIGTTLQSMTFWRGRLAIASDEEVSLSSANSPFQFYPTTLASSLDGDPTALLSPYPGISTLRRLIPFGKELIVFGDRCQLRVHSNDLPLTRGNAQIDLLTSYEYLAAVPPVAANDKLYFLAPKGDTAAAVYEMTPLANATGANFAEPEDLTLAVPRYIPKTTDRIADCPVNFERAYGQSGFDTLTYHSFRSAQGQRVQNAFQQWNLPDGFTLGGMFFKNTRLYLLLVDADNVAHVGMIDTAPNVLDPSSGVMLSRVDMRCTEDQVTLNYSALHDETTVTMPYAISSADARAVARAPGGVGGPKLLDDLLPAPEGYAAFVKPPDTVTGSPPGPTQFVLKGNWTECPMWFGIGYAMRLELTRIYAFDGNGKPLRAGRLGLRRLTIDFADTGYFRVEVTSKGRPTRKYEFTGYRLDDPASIFNAPPNTTGKFSVPLQSENEQTTIVIVNDSHFPCKLTGWEWRGELNLKANRV